MASLQHIQKVDHAARVQKRPSILLRDENSGACICFLLGHQHYQLPAGDVPINLLQCVLYYQCDKLEGNAYFPLDQWQHDHSLSCGNTSTAELFALSC